MISYSKKNLIILLCILNVFLLLSIFYLKNKLDDSNSNLSLLRKETTQLNSDLEKEKVLYNLRNELDTQFYNILSNLINSNSSDLDNFFNDGVKLNNKTIEFNYKDNNYTFQIPDNNMNLRQRAYGFLSDDEFFSIYEILNSGYTNNEKYENRTYSLNIVYKFHNNKWKIALINIDE